MLGRTIVCRLTLVFAALSAPAAISRVLAQTEVADIREDVRGLSQRINELSLRVEQLEHENSILRTKIAGMDGNRDVVSSAQLNGSVAELNASIRSAVASSRAEILQQVATQMENLAKQTNSALDSIGKPGSTAPPRSLSQGQVAKTTFGDAYSKEGVSYTVQKGESVGVIAKKTGSKVQDIIDANKLADPSRIQAGQVLFVPGGK